MIRTAPAFPTFKTWNLSLEKADVIAPIIHPIP